MKPGMIVERESYIKIWHLGEEPLWNMVAQRARDLMLRVRLVAALLP